MPDPSPTTLIPPADEEPKRGPGRPPKADASPRRPGRPTKVENLTKEIEGAYQGLGATIALAGLMRQAPRMMTLGSAMTEIAGPASEAWGKLCAENPKLLAAIEKLLTASAVGELLIAHMPLITALTAAPAAEDGDVDRAAA